MTNALVSRRRAWLVAGCVVLAVLVYLTGWIAYATNGLTAFGRLDQRPPGEPGYSYGADFRVLSLTVTEVLREQDDDPGEGPSDPSDTDGTASPSIDASWVVAEIEITRREDIPDFFCRFELVGPDRRRWDPDPPSLTRALTSHCTADELPVGRPGRVEAVFEIPNVFLDRIYGIAVPDSRTRRATPVIRPAG